MANISSRFLASHRISWAAGAVVAASLLFAGATALGADKPQKIGFVNTAEFAE